MTTLALEVRKHRRTRLPVLVLGLMAFEIAWLAGITALSASRSPEGVRGLITTSLYDYLNFQCLLLGPTIAFLATRVAGVDREERMGQMFRALGEPSRRQFLTKLTLLVGLGTVISMVMLLVVTFVGRQTGLREAASFGNTFWIVLVVSLAATLAVSAVQLALACLFDNSAAGVIIGIAGALVASFLPALKLPMLGWLLPWGLPAAGMPYQLNTPEDQAGPDYALVANPALAAVFAVAMALVWTAAATWLVTRKEENS